MRSVTAFDEDRTTETDNEFTLGMASLLGIFFAVVLICGVFFGFGYSLGRRSPSQPRSGANNANAQTEDAQPPDAPTEQSIIPKSAAATKPSPQQVLAPVAAPASDESPSNPPAAGHADVRRVSTSTPLPTPALASKFGTIMVQIAAVSRQPDADALVSALRKAGFDASVHSQPQDRLLHIQVGPFATRDEAKAMRQKLTDAGYNAFIR